MTRRVPPPPPPGSRPPARPVPVDDAPGPEPSWEEEDLDELDPTLLDPAVWPDDEPDPASDAWLADPEPVEELPDLAAPDDEEDTETSIEPVDSLQLLEPVDLQHDELPVLDLHLEVEVDGRPVAAVATPHRARSHLALAGVDPGRRSVVLRIAGVSVPVEVTVERSDSARVLLGQDVLAGRFLLRP
ncbi:MAG: hypothetical protein KTR31_38480 [Myxococcales bacterium]|nr:hypothetical protein [Myxococcales bacterium]